MQYQDTVIEVIIKKSRTKKESICKVLYIIMTILAILLVNFMALLFGVYYLFALTAAISFGIGYSCYYYITNMRKEFEYSIVNDVLSVDIIRNKVRRQPLFSGSIRDFEMVARVNDERHPLSEFSKGDVLRGICVSGDHKENEWYIYTKWDKQKVLLLLEPDERMLKAFYRYNPRNTMYRPGMQVKG